MKSFSHNAANIVCYKEQYSSEAEIPTEVSSNCSTLALRWDGVIKSIVTNSWREHTHIHRCYCSLGEWVSLARRERSGGKLINDKGMEGLQTTGLEEDGGGEGREIEYQTEGGNKKVIRRRKAACPIRVWLLLFLVWLQSQQVEMKRAGEEDEGEIRGGGKVRVVINLQSQHRSRINSPTFCNTTALFNLVCKLSLHFVPLL